MEKTQPTWATLYYRLNPSPDYNFTECAIESKAEHAGGVYHAVEQTDPRYVEYVEGM